MKRIALSSLGFLALIGLSACSGGVQSVGSSQAGLSQSSGVLSLTNERVGLQGSAVSATGTYTSTPDGQILFTRLADPVGGSSCDASCLQNWSPYMVSQTASVSPPFSAINTIFGRQWALNGKPLYVSKSPVNASSVLSLRPVGFEAVSALTVLRDPRSQVSLAPTGAVPTQPLQVQSIGQPPQGYGIPGNFPGSTGNIEVAQPLYGGFEKPQPFLK